MTLKLAPENIFRMVSVVASCNLMNHSGMTTYETYDPSREVKP